MTLPAGQPCFDRVVMNVDIPLAEALDRELTGYGVIVPQAGLLGEGAGRGVLRFEEGIPIGAKHTGTGRTGGAAISDIAGTGPYRVRLVETATPPPVPEGLSPGTPAMQLAGDEALAKRTLQRVSGSSATEESGELDAVEAFLADEEKIRAIRERAAAEARRRADEWGFETVDRE